MRAPAALAALLLAGLVTPSLGAMSPTLSRCERSASNALATCVKRVHAATRTCYRQTGAACADGSPGALAIGKATSSIVHALQTSQCATATTVAGAWGAQTDQAALASRLATACLHQATSLAARTFGGPHAAVLNAATDETKACLDATYFQAAKLGSAILKAQRSCIGKAHAGGTCDVAGTNAAIAAATSKAEAAIAAKCTSLETAVGLTPTQFLARTAAQARCATATASIDTGPLTLDCGPRAGVPVPPRGEWTQVVLDEATWGTRCGDGSSYAFWLRLAPAGKPLGKVVTDMQGGGVCVFESQCTGVPARLFNAIDDEQPDGGYLSTNAAVNPFSDRTMLFMPYCTQDVHIGGGSTSTFPSITVHRFGALNARAALSYLRDVLWAATNADESGGWQPDDLEVFFAGESAGGFGVEYNYHWMLDDLGWPKTTAVPDSALALDNGTAISVASLGLLVSGTGNPFGWNVKTTLPPYCFGGTCGVGPVIQTATSPRLKGPFQQILNLSNQVDDGQVGTTFFTSIPQWVNAMRAAYCAMKGTPGIHYYLPGIPTPIHTMLRDDDRFTGMAADGVVVRDYVAAAMANPAGVIDLVDAGASIDAAYPGVLPFACPVD